MKFFEGWIGLFKNNKVDRDLLNWARIEYKHDSDFAYHHMVKHGRAPDVGVVR